METYEYHQILKYLYFEGYADSYKDAEELVEELTDEEFDSLYEDVFGIDEGKVEWDNPKGPLQSGFTPREKNRAKRISLGIENPHKSSFSGRRFDLTNKDYERYGKLKIAHDAEKDKKVSKNKRHDFGPIFKNSGSGIETTKGQVKRGTGSYKNITNNNEKLYKNDERQKVYHQNNLKEPKESYEMIVNYLLDKGYANNVESAEVILENMSEGWKTDVLKSAAKTTGKVAKYGAKKLNQSKTGKKIKKYIGMTALGAVGIPLIP